jgi:tight adherence protein C
MTSAQFLFLLIVFAIVCGLVWLGMLLFAPAALRNRLTRFMGRHDDGKEETSIGWAERVARSVRPLTKRAGKGRRCAPAS